MPPQQYFRRALVSGLSPLVVGITIYLLWRMNRWDGFVLLGIVTLMAGVVIFFYGLAQTVNYIGSARHARTESVTQITRNSALLVLLLIANFPAAYWIAGAAIDRMMRYDVVIMNKSFSLVSDFHILGGEERDIAIGDIAPGATTVRRVSTIHRSSLDCSAITVVQGHQLQSVLNHYRSSGTNCIVTINPDGTISITEQKAEH